jgi:cytochrome P450
MLARVELRLLYRELLTRAPRITLDGTPKLLDSIVVNGPEHLPVTFGR